MSASQARLLSITARLSNNELSSQLITNSKVRLATESQKASDEYLNALNATKLGFVHYDDKGASQIYDLTPALIYSYEPLKNQYAIQNAQGKNLVTALDAKNYQETDNLDDFLANYVNVKSVETTASINKREKYNDDYAQYLKDLDNYNNVEYPAYLAEQGNYDKGKAQYEADMLKYEAEKKQYDEIDYPAYLEALRVYNEIDYPAYEAALKNYNDNVLPAYQPMLDQYYKDLADYQKDYKKYQEELQKLPSDDMYKMFTSVVGDIYNPDSCYRNAINGSFSGDVGCYAHVLTYLLGYDIANDKATTEELCTSTGVNYYLEDSDITEAALHSDGQGKKLKPVGDRMVDPSLLCDGDDNYSAPYRKGGVIYRDQVKENMIASAIIAGRKPSEIEILKSDYIYDEATNSVAGIKTLKQKAIDLLYLIKHHETYADYESIVNFTDGDFKSIATVIPPIPPIKPEIPEPPIEPLPPTPPTEPVPPVFNATPPIPPKKPEPPIKPEPEYILAIDDKEKGQWYINLWHMMNGSDSANILEKVDDTAVDVDYPLFTIPGAKKDLLSANYAVILDEQLSDASWLQYALDNGIVTLKKTQYYDPSADSGKIPELDAEGIMWNDVVYSNSEDIREVEDTQAIAIAQAKYEKTLNEIEAKDNKYDTDLKNLDTIHNALQTEYDSIKNVISKNVERSFKAFS